MKLIAKKPCSFGGEKFYIGDEIPAELVLFPKDQEQMGVLAIVEDQEPSTPVLEPWQTSVETMTVLVHAKEGDLPLDITQEGLQAVVDVLSGVAAEAEAIINEMTDGDALILLHIADNRKAIKTAAENRAKALTGESESEGEQ